MKLNELMSLTDWQIVCSITVQFKVDPVLIAAIGWHETRWGRLGAGKRGWYLGYGYYPKSAISEETKGLCHQVYYASKFISRYMKPPYTYNKILEFAKLHWKPGNPDVWANSVYDKYQQLKSGGNVAPWDIRSNQSGSQSTSPQTAASKKST